MDLKVEISLGGGEANDGNKQKAEVEALSKTLLSQFLQITLAVPRSKGTGGAMLKEKLWELNERATPPTPFLSST